MIILSDMQNSLVKKTAEYVRKRLENEGSGHDWEHTRRIWEMAKRLQKIEGGNLELVELASLLHCAAEHDLKKASNENIRSLTMQGVLDVLDISEEYKTEIITIAQQCRFKGDDTERPTTLEGKIVQDADWLEGLGAIGIARGFAAGGYLGRRIHDARTKAMVNVPKEEYLKRKRSGTSINYFYEKSLRLPKFLNTKTAKRVAVKRLQYLKNFLDQFMKEWDVNDFDDALNEPIEIYVGEDSVIK